VYVANKNIEKMSKGIPLTDEDRWDWLDDIAKVTAEKASQNHETNVCIGTCSALTKRYRAYLREKCPENVKIVVVFLWAPEEELLRRVKLRKNHYMQGNMVASQVALMECPEGEEELSRGGISIPIQTVDIEVEEISSTAIEGLKKAGLVYEMRQPDM
jgi:gluconokinase